MWKPVKPQEAAMYVEHYKGVKLSTHKGGWIINDNTRGNHWSHLAEAKKFIDSIQNKLGITD